MYEIGRILRQKMMPCDCDDLHMGQIHALLFILEQPGMTMKELSELLRVSSPSTTSLVDRLVKVKLVLRLQDENNRRFVRLKLTTKGVHLLKEKMDERREIFADILSVLSSKDQEVLFVILKKILESSTSSSIPPRS
jgi:DNA-binding MarR family transcriptional regulator